MERATLYDILAVGEFGAPTYCNRWRKDECFIRLKTPIDDATVLGHISVYYLLDSLNLVNSFDVESMKQISAYELCKP
jgi:hypothetical protein